MPIVMDVPLQAVKSLGLETWIATCGGPLFGGCQLWTSTDNDNFHYAATLNGASAMGVTTATFPSGSDPDTVNTCSVDLTQSRGQLLPGSASDADNARTLCFVCNTDGSNGEYFSYEQATLTAKYKYDLGVSGANPGYLRRGLFGSTIASHPSGSLFVRLRPGSYLTQPYIASDIGKTIYFKLLAFNIYGGGQQSLDEVSSLSHTIGGPPTGAAGTTPLSTFHGGAVLAQTDDVATGGQITNNVAAFTAGPSVVSPSSSLTTIQSVALTTVGGEVLVSYSFTAENLSGAVNGATVQIYRDGTLISVGGVLNIFTSLSSGYTTTAFPSLSVTDSPAAGAHTYTLEIGTANTYTVTVGAINLAATELRR